MTRTPKAYFTQMYAESADPWGFETKWYERRKYDLTLAALPRPRYASAFEPGCSIGVLSERLAERCDRLVCSEQMPEAATQAVRRLQNRPHVEVRTAEIPEQWPEGPFDLLVLSELCYYFDRSELRRVLDRAELSLEPGASILAVHWTGPTDYPLSGTEAHGVIDATPTFERVIHHEEPEFMLDVWRFSDDCG